MRNRTNGSSFRFRESFEIVKAKKVARKSAFFRNREKKHTHELDP